MQSQYLVKADNSNNQKSFDNLIVEAEKKHNFKINAKEEQNNVMDATFISVRNGDFYIETACKVNLTTREIFDIEENEEYANYVNVLDREFVHLQDGTEFNVEQNTIGEYYLSGINKESVIDNIKKVSVNNEGYVTVYKNPAMKSR